MRNLIPAAALLALALACGQKEPAKAPAAPAPAPAPAAAPAAAAPAPAAGTATAQAGGAAAEAKQIFDSRCVACHGANGLGDGVAAASLNPKPRAYSDPEWQKSVTDEHIAKVIVEGGAAVGKSALMPPNPDLAGKKEVVDAMVALIRGYAK